MDKHVKTTLVKTDAHDVTRFRLSLIIYVLSHDQLRAASLIGRNASRDVEHYRMFTASRSTVRQFNVWRQTTESPNSKATGPDGIQAHILDFTADEAAVGLQLIFQTYILLIIRKPEAYTRW